MDGIQFDKVIYLLLNKILFSLSVTLFELTVVNNWFIIMVRLYLLSKRLLRLLEFGSRVCLCGIQVEIFIQHKIKLLKQNW